MKRIVILTLLASCCGGIIAQNVGIGTPTPEEKLHIKDGNLKLEEKHSLLFDLNPADTAGIRFYSNNANRGSLLYRAFENKLNLSHKDTTHGLVFDFNTNKLFLGRDFPITAQEQFGVTIPTAGFGGIYLETRGGSSGKPFYGYAIDSTNHAWHYYDGVAESWILNVDGPKVFVNKSNSIELLNDALYIDGANNRVGVSTDAPQSTLHVNGTARVSANFPSLDLYKNSLLGGKLQVSNSILYLRNELPSGEIRLWNSTGSRLIVRAGGEVDILGDLTVSGSALRVENNQVLVGGIFSASGYKLCVDGKMICEEVMVQMSNAWPDYVFSEEYERLSLRELRRFIEVNKHLPGVPSSREVEMRAGIELGEINRVLLEKVEELTLYILEQEQRIQKLENALGDEKS